MKLLQKTRRQHVGFNKAIYRQNPDITGIRRDKCVQFYGILFGGQNRSAVAGQIAGSVGVVIGERERIVRDTESRQLIKEALRVANASDCVNAPAGESSVIDCFIRLAQTIDPPRLQPHAVDGHSASRRWWNGDCGFCRVNNQCIDARKPCHGFAQGAGGQ